MTLKTKVFLLGRVPPLESRKENGGQTFIDFRSYKKSLTDKGIH